MALPSSLGDDSPGVKELVAIAPTAPSLPQAPQVSQFGVSSTLSMIVAPLGSDPLPPPLDGVTCVFWMEDAPPPQPVNAMAARRIPVYTPAVKRQRCKSPPKRGWLEMVDRQCNSRELSLD